MANSTNGVQATATYTTHTKCVYDNGSPAPCPAAQHTPYLSAFAFTAPAYKHTGGGSASGTTAPPDVYQSISATDINLDIFDCLEGNSNCFFSAGTEGTTKCSLLGIIFTVVLQNLKPQTEIAFGSFKKIPSADNGRVPGSCTAQAQDTAQFCSYYVQNWCSNTATPDYSHTTVSHVWTVIGDGAFGWRGLAFCLRGQFSLPGTPWACVGVDKDLPYTTASFPPAVCTWKDGGYTTISPQ
jgi:hypothetical protein